MKKVLITYASRTGKTEKMAQFIAEGIRMAGHNAEMKKISQINEPSEIDGYDAYVVGSPTYHRDMTAGMKTFLFKMEHLNLTGKMGGAFGSYTHSGESAPMIYDTLQFVFKMDMTDLGALSLKEAVVDASDGMKACQEYGKAIGKKLPA